MQDASPTIQALFKAWNITSKLRDLDTLGTLHSDHPLLEEGREAWEEYKRLREELDEPEQKGQE